MRVAAVLPLTGRYAFGGLQAADALRAWARASGDDLTVEDCGASDDLAARLAARLAPAADVFLGPYGSGLARAAAGALAGTPHVMWNHGAAALPRTGARVVDVLAPAERYWTGLADLLRGAPGPAAVLHADSGFGRAVAEGAREALAGAGCPVVHDAPFSAARALDAVRTLRDRGAGIVVGCGRLEDDLALGAALAGGPETVALVACGVREAADALREAVLGWTGPTQWAPGGQRHGGGYPAAQALAAVLLAGRALALAGSARPDDVWDAARALREETFLGPFAVDREGRQTAATPALVRWEAGDGGPVMRTVWRPPPAAGRDDRIAADPA